MRFRALFFGLPLATSLVLAGEFSAPPLDPEEFGQWSSVQSWPIVAVHASLLPSGDVLAWTDYTANAGAQLWRRSTNTFVPKTYSPVSLFCAGHSFLADGRLFVAGGIVDLVDDLGPHETTFFDPVSESWSNGPLMYQGRYYPSSTTLADGRVFISGGTTTCSTCYADRPEIYDPVTNTSAPLPASATRAFKYYPHHYLLPDGRIIVVAQDDKAIDTRVLDVAAPSPTWTVVDSRIIDGHSSVMYLPGKFMKCGRATADAPGSSALATTFTLDMSQPSPEWQATAPMASPRSFHNLTILPDGQVLVTGGGTTTSNVDYVNAVLAAELWSPVTKTWTTLASAQKPRMYHSTALLLPDATVLVAGSGRQNGRSQPDPADQSNAEIFSPPYLFHGPRPVISGAPALLPYGTGFTVTTPEAAQIASVALIAPGAVTHAFNQNQRYVPLTFTAGAGTLSVQAPANGNLAPPGPYMLFLVDTNGVPSVASWVRLPAPQEDASPPTAPSGLDAAPSLDRVDLTWSAATDNLGVARYNVHRTGAAGTPLTPANRIGQPTSTSFTDEGLAAGTYYYTVTAEDAAGNIGPPSNEDSASVTQDDAPPAVSVTSPAASAVVSATVPVVADATDDVGVVGVQFLLDGQSLGAEDSVPPWSVDWNTQLTPNGPHALSARGRDGGGNQTTATAVPVTVSNAQVQGIVLAYSLDENGGTVARDSSGNANRGTVTSALWTASGHSASALSFDGSLDYVQAENSASLDVAGTGLTVEMWANFTSSSPVDYALLGKPWTAGTTGNPHYQYGIEFDANGAQTLDFYFGDTTGTKRGPFSMTPPLGVWTHLAFTLDGTAVTGYLDGVLQFTTPVTASIQARPTPLIVGVDASLEQGYKGRLDDVRIYNRALTLAEVTQDMNTPVPAAVPPVPDGSFGTAMRASRASATEIGLTWDVSSCVPAGHHVVYGDLAGLPSYQVAGGVCGLGTSGTFAWSGVPADDLWFLVVGDNGSGTEGMWGTASDGPMSGTSPSGVCGMTSRINLSACP